MITELIRSVNYFPGISQRDNQINDKASGAPVNVNNLMAIEKMIKQKLSLPFVAHFLPFNPFKPNGISHCYQLDQSISVLILFIYFQK